MRKAIFNSAVWAIALMLASCSADEPVARNTLDGSISYAVVTDNQTRAAHSYCNINKPEEFRVWAKHSKEAGNDVLYINGDRIVKTGDYYTDVDCARYWPEEGKLSFYAVADGAFGNEGETGKPTFSYSKDDASNEWKAVVKDYTIENDVTKQLDLMYAVKDGVGKSDSHAGSGVTPEVELNFRHALSQICFKAMNEHGADIIIHSITVENVKNKGTYTLPGESTDGNFENHDGTETASTSGHHGEWSLEDTEVSYKINLNNGVHVPSDGTSYSLTYGGKANHETFDKALNLLPQNGQVSFKLNLSVANVNNDKSETATELSGDEYSFDVDVNWKEGIRYIYTLVFPKDWNSDKRIKYSVITDDFKEVEIDPVINGHGAVLMRYPENGQPALYFATKDIGAGTSSDFGHFFWWGDISGHASDDEFNFSSKNPAIETYDKANSSLKDDGWLTDDGKLTAERDAAVQKWGGAWRMPTVEDFKWLTDKNNCEWSWEDSHKRFKVVSKTTGGTIFFPAAGYINGTTWHQSTEAAISGYYWTSEPSESQKNAIRLRVDFKNDAVSFDLSGRGNRYDGFPVRPVANSIKVAETVDAD